MIRRLAAGVFHGTRLNVHEFPGLRLSEWTYCADRRFPTHSHESAFFNMVIRGAYTETHGKEARTYRPYVLVFHPEGEAHSNHIHQAGTRIFDVEIKPQWLERLGEHLLPLDRSAEFSGGPPVWLTRRLYNEFHHLDDVSPLAIEGLALELFAEASRRSFPVAEPRRLRWLERTRDMLHARFAENLSLEEIAQAAGVHPDHLTHAFRREFGRTVCDYIRELRIEFSCRKIETSEMSLVEIALAAGFADQSHFTKVFKRIMGMTPGDFQSNHRLHRFRTTK
jgi:AraC family transcriptional regulator